MKYIIVLLIYTNNKIIIEPHPRLNVSENYNRANLWYIKKNVYLGAHYSKTSAYILMALNTVITNIMC